MKLIDLTHTLTAGVPQFSNCGFHLNLAMDYKDCEGEVKFRGHTVEFYLGTGTHLDAPVHIKEGGLCIHEIPIQNLLCPLIVIDVSQKAHENYLVSSDDILTFEENHSIISAGSFVIFNTGWGKLWPGRTWGNASCSRSAIARCRWS